MENLRTYKVKVVYQASEIINAKAVNEVEAKNMAIEAAQEKLRDLNDARIEIADLFIDDVDEENFDNEKFLYDLAKMAVVHANTKGIDISFKDAMAGAECVTSDMEMFDTLKFGQIMTHIIGMACTYKHQRGEWGKQ